MENKNISKIISNILKTGVFASALFVFTGIFLLFTKFQGVRVTFLNYSFNQMLEGLQNFDYYAYMMFGIFILILTPILRILGLLVVYFLEKDYNFVIIAILILIILSVSLVLGVTHN